MVAIVLFRRIKREWLTTHLLIFCLWHHCTSLAPRPAIWQSSPSTHRIWSPHDLVRIDSTSKQCFWKGFRKDFGNPWLRQGRLGESNRYVMWGNDEEPELEDASTVLYCSHEKHPSRAKGYVSVKECMQNGGRIAHVPWKIWSFLILLYFFAIDTIVEELVTSFSEEKSLHCSIDRRLPRAYHFAWSDCWCQNILCMTGRRASCSTHGWSVLE